jgi:hypothetical protein
LLFRLPSDEFDACVDARDSRGGVCEAKKGLVKGRRKD